MSRIRKFIRLQWHEKLLFCESLLLHLFIGLLLKIVPFRKIPGLFANRQFETPTLEEDQPRHMVSGQQSILVENVKVAVQRAGAVSPWRNRCLVSSLAGRWMLSCRGIQSSLSLGLGKLPDGKTIAHSWLMCWGTEIVPRNGDFTPLYTF